MIIRLNNIKNIPKKYRSIPIELYAIARLVYDGKKHLVDEMLKDEDYKEHLSEKVSEYGISIDEVIANAELIVLGHEYYKIRRRTDETTADIIFSKMLHKYNKQKEKRVKKGKDEGKKADSIR